MKEAGSRRAVFVDRDGVLVEEVGHLHRRDQLRLMPGAAAAVAALRARGFLVIVVTNQSAVARGLLSEEQLAVLHRELQAMLERAGTRWDDLFYCPHHPSAGIGPYRVACPCRKPAPGMLHAARDRHGLDLGRSFLVGDKRSDLEAARRAGVTAVLVRSGHGASEAIVEGNPAPAFVCDDLAAAARWVLDQRTDR